MGLLGISLALLGAQGPGSGASPQRPPQAQAPGADEPWKRVRLESQYRDPFANFRIDFPKGWKAVEQGSQVSFEGPRDGIYTPTVALYVERPKKDLAEYVEEHRDQIRRSKDYSGLKFAGFEVLTQGGKNAVLFTAKLKEGIVPMETLWFFLDAGERKFALSFTTTEVLFARYANRIHAIVRSLRVFEEQKAEAKAREAYLHHYQLGIELSRKNKFDEALAQFEKASALVPGYPDALGMVGVMRAAIKDFAGAAAALGRAAEIDPDGFEYSHNLSQVLFSAGKLPEAEGAAERAIAIDPFREPAWTNLGYVRIRLKQFGRAREAFSRSILLDPESAGAHYGFGAVAEAMGSSREARREYQEALKIDPKHQGAREGLRRVNE